jgi:hypothetical protein
MTDITSADADGKILHYYHIVPIGSVVAWLKSYTNTPALGAGWVECNGQVLSDATSVYNGQTIPDLNGTGVGNHRFLRGQNTSGGTGTVGATGSVDVTYYEVVWIMRIK